MFNFIKRKLEKRRLKRTFQEYGHTVKVYDLPGEGVVHFATWDNPLEKPKGIEQSMVDYFKNFIQKGDFAIDIGAHIGDTTVPMALAAGKTGFVLAFDPNPYIFKILEVNCALNADKTNIKALQNAIMDTEGEFFYNSSEATFNNGGISKTEASKHGKYALGQKVRGIRLYHHLKTEYPEQLGRLTFIKIDTEGLDKMIIESFTDLLQDIRPTVMAECFKRLTRAERDAFYDLFANLDYELFGIGEFSFTREMNPEKIDRAFFHSHKHFDFCAVPKEKVSGLHR
jgi:FkbM family methyltransferase